jgi:hypothetical protein
VYRVDLVARVQKVAAHAVNGLARFVLGAHYGNAPRLLKQPAQFSMILHMALEKKMSDRQSRCKSWSDILDGYGKMRKLS